VIASGKTWSRALVLALAFLAAPAARGQDPKAEAAGVLARAASLLEGGKYAEAEEAYRQAVRARPEDPRGRVGLGSTLLSVWRFPEAREWLAGALEIDPPSVAAHVGLARCDIQDLEYRAAFDHLRAAFETAPEDADGLAVLGLLLLHLDELDRAGEVLERVLRRHPRHVYARAYEAHLRILRKDLPEASRRFAAALKDNRQNMAAYVGLGQALSAMERPAEALSVLDAGIRRNPRLPPLHSTRAFVLFKLKRNDESLRAYRRALEIDPEYPGGHGLCSFLEGTASESKWPENGPAKEALREAVQAMEAGDPERAAAAAREASAGDPDNVFAALVHGAAAYGLDDFGTALGAARKAIALDPRAPLPRTLFLAAWTLKQESKRLELSKTDFHEKFRALEDTDVPGIERVFPNFASLTLDDKKVVRAAVAPFSRYLPELERQGVKHTILPLYRHLTDMPGMTEWKGHPTFDGRNYDAVRGAAGQWAVTGVETLWAATRMGPSIIAHEFAHQVHRFAMNGEEKSEIERLYNKAKKEHRCLDYYAAENDLEYFAQGYEAFVSPFKRPTSSETARHTRADLEAKDPELLAFLRRITGR
jgi:tetratricopeptide (TPR) repeat protein